MKKILLFSSLMLLLSGCYNQPIRYGAFEVVEVSCSDYHFEEELRKACIGKYIKRLSFCNPSFYDELEKDMEFIKSKKNSRNLDVGRIIKPQGTCLFSTHYKGKELHWFERDDSYAPCNARTYSLKCKFGVSQKRGIITFWIDGYSVTLKVRHIEDYTKKKSNRC